MLTPALKLMQSSRRIITKNVLVFLLAFGFVILGYHMFAVSPRSRITYVHRQGDIEPGHGYTEFLRAKKSGIDSEGANDVNDLEHTYDIDLEEETDDQTEDDPVQTVEEEEEDEATGNEEDEEKDDTSIYHEEEEEADTDTDEDRLDEDDGSKDLVQTETDPTMKRSEVMIQKKQGNANRPNKPEPKLKTILFWTKYYKDPYFGIRGLGRDPFLLNHCKVNTCNATNDISRVGDADAVVMHMRDPLYPFPSRRDTRQLFVFFLHEAPPASFYNVHFSLRPSHAAMYNVTMSYRRDSDIPMFYCGDIRSHKHPYTYQLHTWANKTRNVVWMSSHCRTDSKRELYVQALAKYIDVDVYGRCGNLVCPKSEGTKCEENFQYTYKFFFAAENAICKDYVSEKLGRGLGYEMIPIVYGGVNYTAALPPRSVIDITEYESPEHLAKHLRYISENESEFLKYFEWKGKYGRKRVTKTMAMCDLCAKLHDPTYHKTYNDIVKWWKEDTCSTEFIQNQINKGFV